MALDGDGRVRRIFRRMTSAPEVLEDERLQESTRSCGARACAGLSARSRVTVAGELRTVTVRPRAGVPALEAELYDGSGSVLLTFLGRRRIRGIEPGRELVAHGLVGDSEGRPTLFNPRYELRPTGSA